MNRSRSRSPAAKVVSEAAKAASALRTAIEEDKKREEIAERIANCCRIAKEKKKREEEKREEEKRKAATQEAMEKVEKAHEEALRIVAVARAERQAERKRLLGEFMDDLSEADQVFRAAADHAIRHFQRAANAAGLRVDMQELQRLHEELQTLACDS